MYQIGATSFCINHADIDQFKNWNTKSPEKDDLDIDLLFVGKLLRALVPDEILTISTIPSTVVLFIQRKYDCSLKFQLFHSTDFPLVNFYSCYSFSFLSLSRTDAHSVARKFKSHRLSQ